MRKIASNQGLTLIELLLVIVIIVVLATFVGTGFASMQRKSLSVQCLNRMKQLTQGFLLYTADQNGLFPRSAHSGGSWARAVAPYLGEPDLTVNAQYRLRELFSCPQHQRDRPTSRGWSYGTNVFLEISSERYFTPAGLPVMSRDRYEGMPQTWHRLIDIHAPSKTILLGENGSNTIGADHFMVHQWEILSTAQNAMATDRHGSEKAHFAFLDGHVEALPVEATFNPAQGINRWHPERAIDSP